MVWEGGRRPPSQDKFVALPLGIQYTLQALKQHGGAASSDLGGCMLGGKIGLPELLILLAIVFFLFGAKRLPEIGKGIGEGIKNFKGAMKRGDKE